MLEALDRMNAGKRVLVEGGPTLLAAFYKARLLDEQFLTGAPQISGPAIHCGASWWMRGAVLECCFHVMRFRQDGFRVRLWIGKMVKSQSKP